MAQHYLLNPRRKTRRKVSRRRRRNPTLATVNPRRRRRARAVTVSYRNPRRARQLLSLRGVGLNDVAFGTAGMVVTKTLAPQLTKVIGQVDFGMMRYVAEVGAAMLGAFAIQQFAKSKKGAQSFLYGGLLVTAGGLWENEIKPRIGFSGMGYYPRRFPAARPLLPAPGAVPAITGRTGAPTYLTPSF